MNDIISKKIKKYVLYISTVFFVIFGVHLSYVYLYDGAESIPEEGGTVSEAIIWSFPHLNPLLPSSDHNGYINGLLYRSMLEYSTESESFETDLVSCDLSNLLYIECILENNLKWSDGTDIGWEDIKATLWIISKTKVNPIIASLLENTTIEVNDDTISFSNTKKDINFLHIFLQPILPASVIEELDSENIEWKFSEVNGVYSWRFILSNISQDETVGITKITLGKNEQYFGNPLYINFLILNLFRDEVHFLKNRNSFNIFNDRDNIIGESNPRLKSYSYNLSQFVGVFFNTDEVKKDFRAYLDTTINRDTIVETIGENNALATYNPFLSSTNIDSESSGYDLVATLASEWYYTKKELLKDSLLQQDSQQQEIALISEEAKIQEVIVEEIITQESLSYIQSPSTEKYSFVSEDNVLITWRVDPWVTAVYINDYQLSWYTQWSGIFYYRLLESYDSIIEWENTYTILFETDGVKKEIETFVYVYNTDSDELAEIKTNFFSPPKETETPQEDTSKEEITETVTEEAKDLSSLSPADIEALDDRFYYNKDGKARSVNIIYAETDSYMKTTIDSIVSQLTSIWLQTNLTSLSLWDITIGLRNESLEYDMMVIGINLWYFSSNIFPYFHSSQIKNGYNIANFKKLSLDILLEELKSNNLSVEKRNELEEKMLDIMKEEHIIKVLYTPNISLLVDKNIKSFSLPGYLPDVKHRSSPLTNSYLSEKRIIQEGSKGFFWFIKYVFGELFRSNSSLWTD